MWFKQASVYELSKTMQNPDELMRQLQPLSFTPCLPSLPLSLGWIPPVGTDPNYLVHAANGFWMICMQFEEKILPAGVVREAVYDKIKEIEAKENRVVRANEKQSLKEECVQTLLPKAFTKKSTVYGFIDIQKKRLIIDSTTPVKLERFVAFLKRAITPIQIDPVDTQKPASIMTKWLKFESPSRDFTVGQAAVLQDPQQFRRVIRCAYQNLTATGIQSLLNEGCEVTQLALAWKDQLQFNLTASFALKNIKFEDAVVALSKDDYTETAEQRFDADFVIMTEVLSQLINELMHLFTTTSVLEAVAA